MEIEKLFFYSKGGLDKHWIYGSKLNYNLSCDFIQKLNYDYEDYSEYNNPENIKSRKDVYYIVQLAVWIMDTYELFEKLIVPRLLINFVFSEESKNEFIKKYLKAIRSAIVAHPLSTNRHPDYGFNGDFISIDIGFPRQQVFWNAFKYRTTIINLQGVVEEVDAEDCDFCITGYRKNKGAEFYEHVGFNKADIDGCVEFYKKKMNELDVYMKKLKKSNFYKEVQKYVENNKKYQE